MAFSESSISKFKDLTIRDKLNYPFIVAYYMIGAAILIKEALEEDPELNIIKGYVQWLINLIPDQWKDKQFKEELKAAQVKVTEDIRPIICGLPVSLAYCKKHDIPTFRETIKYKPELLNQALINLLNRRGLLSKVKWKEIATGKKFDPNEPPEISEEDLLGEGFNEP